VTAPFKVGDKVEWIATAAYMVGGVWARRGVVREVGREDGDVYVDWGSSVVYEDPNNIKHLDAVTRLGEIA
jgi:hypothetical protein